MSQDTDSPEASMSITYGLIPRGRQDMSRVLSLTWDYLWEICAEFQSHSGGSRTETLIYP